MTHNHLKLFLSIRRTDIADSVGFYNSSESPLDFRKCNETIITPRTGSTVNYEYSSEYSEEYSYNPYDDHLGSFTKFETVKSRFNQIQSQVQKIIQVQLAN